MQSGLVFDCTGSGRDNGTNVQLWQKENVPWHRWILTRVEGPQPVNDYTTKSVNLTGTRQVVDVFNGVESIYNKNYTAPGDSTYNCAALVKKYYQKIYGVEPYNLLPNKRPMVNGRTLQKVSNPQVGDIAGITTSKVNGHWAIVKAVVGNQVVLFEQNWKANGKTKVNRRINISGVNFYRL